MLPPKGSHIAVAMSGGVDSAVTAALLTEQGYPCTGVTLRLVPDHPDTSVFEPCCGLEAASDARRVCEKLGIPHRTIHLVDRFNTDIIRHFMREYNQGRTPNPCVRCNRMIKFGALYLHADQLEADYVAMGHYVRLEPLGNRMALRRATYRPKDQSYVLAPLTQPQLRRALFPLGELTKAEVRDRARPLDIRSANKPESQEICFVPDRNYANFITQRTQPSLPGDIVDQAGKVLGQHKGLIHYTIGQRRGLGIGAERPLYVLQLNTDKNQLVVGFEEETICRRFTTGPVAWGGWPRQDQPFECKAQLRSRHTPGPARVTPVKGGTKVELLDEQRSITPGQWAVFYTEEDFVLGAAVIRSFE